ncbi:MAG: hypothetical protein H6832_12585 [Planctomycetes bacterium]|nr:hypothetical protein [Planctomycetota bacterium]MCB9891664.1 hypothetical protein [Planctomycetota bacterium]MCB9919230.1 hypothetical protein [Planctomycetota bacterium]
MRLLPQIGLAVSLLAVTAFAQTGTYSTFGAGCAGSSGNVVGCVNANLNGTWGGNGGVASFALGANSAAAPLIICAVDLYAASSSGNKTGNLWLLAADSAGAPSATVLGTTTVQWTPVGAWHRGNFAQRVFIAPNTKFFIAFDNPGKLPYMSAGPDTVEHWHSGPTWKGPYMARWNYNVICCQQVGGAIPAIGNQGVPSISTPYSVTLGGALATTPALLITGVSNTTWGVIPLPLDLTGAGAPNCKLLVSFDFTLGTATDASGNATVQLTLPNQTSLVGFQFYQQWAVLDTAANALGLAFSNGGAGKIGT